MTAKTPTRSCSCCACVVSSGKSSTERVPCLFGGSTVTSGKGSTKMPGRVTVKENSNPLRPLLTRKVRQLDTETDMKTTDRKTRFEHTNQGVLFQEQTSFAPATANQRHVSFVSSDSNVGCRNSSDNIRIGQQEPRGNMSVVDPKAGNTTLRPDAQRNDERSKVTPAPFDSSSLSSTLYYVRRAQERIKAQRALPRPRPKDLEVFSGKRNMGFANVRDLPVKGGKTYGKVVKIERGWPPRAPSPSSLPDPSDFFHELDGPSSDDEVKSPIDHLYGLFIRAREIPPLSYNTRSSSSESSSELSSLYTGYGHEDSDIGPKLDIMSDDLAEFLKHEHASLLRRHGKRSRGRSVHVVEDFDDTPSDYAERSFVNSLPVDRMLLEAGKESLWGTRSLDYDLKEIALRLEVKCPRPIRAWSSQFEESQIFRC
ncbi:hypothetical protein F5880DRAFT_790609 [Lentinula raphanica]|nr:hypothetical protein F5880DRAFT_790609 [Lentinula raphanica]